MSQIKEISTQLIPVNKEENKIINDEVNDNTIFPIKEIILQPKSMWQQENHRSNAEIAINNIVNFEGQPDYYDKVFECLGLTYNSVVIDDNLKPIMKSSIIEIKKAIDSLVLPEDKSLLNHNIFRGRINLDVTPFHYSRKVGVRIQELPKEDDRRHFLQSLFLFILRPLIPVKYSTTEVFLEEYPDFTKRSVIEIERLRITANWMDLVFYTLSPKNNKTFLISLIPRICEGGNVRYITGSGETKATADRVSIYRKEGNCVKILRPPRKRSRTVGSESVPLSINIPMKKKSSSSELKIVENSCAFNKSGGTASEKNINSSTMNSFSNPYVYSSINVSPELNQNENSMSAIDLQQIKKNQLQNQQLLLQQLQYQQQQDQFQQLHHFQKIIENNQLHSLPNNSIQNNVGGDANSSYFQEPQQLNNFQFQPNFGLKHDEMNNSNSSSIHSNPMFSNNNIFQPNFHLQHSINSNPFSNSYPPPPYTDINFPNNVQNVQGSGYSFLKSNDNNVVSSNNNNNNNNNSSSSTLQLTSPPFMENPKELNNTTSETIENEIQTRSSSSISSSSSSSISSSSSSNTTEGGGLSILGVLAKQILSDTNGHLPVETKDDGIEENNKFHKKFKNVTEYSNILGKINEAVNDQTIENSEEKLQKTIDMFKSHNSKLLLKQMQKRFYAQSILQDGRKR
jgi:hypothetical protein